MALVINARPFSTAAILGTPDLVPTITDLNTEVEALVPGLRQFFGPQRRVALSLDPTAAGPVLLSREGLDRLVVRIATNALEAMPADGVFTLETSSVVVPDPHTPGREPPAPGRYVVLSMTDTGEGIPPMVIAGGRLCEPFFTTRGPAHEGLGLSAAYGEMVAHGGGMTIESELGKGTVVRTYWPEATRELNAPSE